MSDSSFSYQIGIVRVAYGQVKGREGSLGLVLRLVSSIEQYFLRNNILFVFFVVLITAAEAPCIRVSVVIIAIFTWQKHISRV